MKASTASDKPMPLCNRTSLIQEFYGNNVDTYNQGDISKLDSLDVQHNRGATSSAAAATEAQA